MEVLSFYWKSQKILKKSQSRKQYLKDLKFNERIRKSLKKFRKSQKFICIFIINADSFKAFLKLKEAIEYHVMIMLLNFEIGLSERTNFELQSICLLRKWRNPLHP